MRKLGKTDCGPVPGFLFFASFRKALFLCLLPDTSLFVRPDFSGPPPASEVFARFLFNGVNRFQFSENLADRGFQAAVLR